MPPGSSELWTPPAAASTRLSAPGACMACIGDGIAPCSTGSTNGASARSLWVLPRMGTRGIRFTCLIPRRSFHLLDGAPQDRKQLVQAARPLDRVEAGERPQRRRHPEPLLQPVKNRVQPRLLA